MTLTHYQLFGERNSGTRILDSIICNNIKLLYTNRYGLKHWFIKDHYPRGEQNDIMDKNCIKSLDDPETNNTLFIFIVRDPLNWMKSMNRMPYHALQLKKLPFSKFIRNKWDSYEHHQENKIEEFENICQLRNMKNKHFLALRNKVKNFHIIRLNTLEDDLKKMVQKFNLELKHDNIDMLDFGYAPASSADLRNKVKRVLPRKYDVDNISDEDLEFIKNQLDLDIEKELGFIL